MESVTAYVVGTIGVMILAGILGAYCRKIFEASEVSKDAPPANVFAGFFTTVIPGVVASFVVPLFLNVGKSEVFANAVTGVHYIENIFIVFAFCLLAAVSARSFVNALARQALQKAEETDRKVDEVRDLVSEEPNPAMPTGRNLAEQKTAAFQGSKPERLILQALSSGAFVRRSVTGIAKETKLDKTEVIPVLQDLIAKGLVVEGRSSRTGGLLYQMKLDIADRPSAD